MPRRNTQIKQYLSIFLDRPLAVHRIFGKIAGGLSAGVMLSQAYYWCDKGDNPEWFWKTQAEWQEETLLSRREQETARRSLLLLRTPDGVPVWEEQRRGQPARLFFRLNLDALGEVIETYLNGEKRQSSMAENANQEWLETPIKDGEKRQSILHRVQTENTTENTPNSDLDFFSNANGKSNGAGLVDAAELDGRVNRDYPQAIDREVGNLLNADQSGNGYSAQDDPDGIAESPEQLAALQNYHQQLADMVHGDITPEQASAGLNQDAAAAVDATRQYWLNFVGGVDMAQIAALHAAKGRASGLINNGGAGSTARTTPKTPPTPVNGNGAYNGGNILKVAPKAPSGARKGAGAKVKAGSTG